MKITHKSILWRLGGSLVVASVLGVGMVGGLQAQDKSASVSQQLGGTLGVVDYSNLIKAHPDYERLQQFDQQLDGLKAEIDSIPMLERNTTMRAAQERFRKEYEKAEAEMEAEQAAIKAEMDGMQASMKSKLEAQAAAGQREIQDKLEAYIKKHAPEMAAQNDQQPDTPTIMPGGDEARRNLMLLAQRKKEAIRLEQEKAHREQVEAERARIDSEIAAYEDQVMKSHQQEKLNLQLKVQVAKDEAEQAELQDQLEAISDDEERLKDAKRAELEGQFKAFRSESDAKQSAEVKSKQAAVDQEVLARIGQLPASSGAPAPRPTSRPKQPEITPEMKALIAKEEARLRAEMEASAEEARRKMEAEQGIAVARLKAKQQELKVRMEKVHAELEKVVKANSTEGLSEATKAKVAMKQAQYDKLKSQREELYDKMVADLKGDIGRVARDKKIDIVLGSYLENRSCTDLTDYAMVAIKTKSRPDSE